MNKNAIVRTSKFLSYVLRHRPDAIGLELDEEGWADVDSLIRLAGADGHMFDRALLDEVVATNDKKRFAFSLDGSSIRAVQGHSAENVAIAYEPVTPPEALYHGTATRFLGSIGERGLVPGSRHLVHLSPDHETAVAVGQRHGKPAVLRVRAEAMHRDRHEFYRVDNGVWLTAHVPAHYLEIPS